MANIPNSTWMKYYFLRSNHLGRLCLFQQCSVTTHKFLKLPLRILFRTWGSFLLCGDKHLFSEREFDFWKWPKINPVEVKTNFVKKKMRLWFQSNNFETRSQRDIRKVFYTMVACWNRSFPSQDVCSLNCMKSHSLFFLSLNCSSFC